MSRLNIPIPDPSALTTEQLRREVAGLKALLEARLDAIDQATKLFQDNLTRVPTDTDKQIQHLKELHSQRFAAIEMQFRERDTRFDQEKSGSALAVTAALQAQKEAAAAQNASNAEAVRKSEMAVAKQIDGIGTQLTAAASALADKIETINSRINRGEGISSGSATSLSTTIAIAAVIVSILVGSFTVFGSKRAPEPQSPTPVFQTQPLAPVTIPGK